MVCNAVIPAVEDEATGNPTGISIRLGMTGAIIAITKRVAAIIKVASGSLSDRCEQIPST
jgi:hypothetical protein